MLKKKTLTTCFALISIAVFCQNDSTLSSPKSKWVLFPVIARSIETGWSFGAASSTTFRMFKKDTISRTSNLQLLSLYSVKKQFIAAIEGSQYFGNESFILNEEISYSSFPDKFWGLGNQSKNENEEEYSFKQYYINLHLLRKIGKKLFVGVLFETQKLMNVDYQQGGIFDVEKVAGRNGYFIAGLGGSITYDSRNNAFSPNNGTFIQLYFNHFDRYLGSQFVYTNFVLDCRKYIEVSKKTVLALQMLSFNNSGEQIPLRSLATLGGTNSMRGFYDGRFRDKQQLVIQSEYRFPLYKRFSLVAFGSMGDVSERVNLYSLKNMKYAFGGGIRFAVNKSEKLNIRMDYGINSIGGSGLYFQLGEAF